MPELPDVEARRQVLERHGLHKRIEDVHLHDAEQVLAASASTLRRRLKGHELERTKRHGKWLLAEVGDAPGWLALHFGMTGDLRLVRQDEETPDHTRLELRLEDESRLAYVCQRKLGRIALTEDPKTFAESKHLGPDALDADEESFLERLKGRRTHVKAALMDQSIVAGIGNVWADEILFHAGVDPRAKLDGLGEERLRRLHRAMRHVLQVGVERDARVDDLPRSWLLPHREEGQACPSKCGGKVEKVKLGGRSAYYCPGCQKR